MSFFRTKHRRRSLMDSSMLARGDETFQLYPVATRCNHRTFGLWSCISCIPDDSHRILLASSYLEVRRRAYWKVVVASGDTHRQVLQPLRVGLLVTTRFLFAGAPWSSATTSFPCTSAMLD
jgi:hypothetical protein